jgi:hypothetical protein
MFIPAMRRGSICSMRVTDTAATALAIQLRVRKAMPGEQHLLMAYEMSLFARELARARIRQEHPQWGEELVGGELLRLAFLPEPLPAKLR